MTMFDVSCGLLNVEVTIHIYGERIFHIHISNKVYNTTSMNDHM